MCQLSLSFLKNKWLVSSSLKKIGSLGLKIEIAIGKINLGRVWEKVASNILFNSVQELLRRLVYRKAQTDVWKLETAI